MLYSDSENDIELNDRIKDKYKNYIFFEKYYKLVEIKYEEYKALYDYTIKENVDETNFNNNFSNKKRKTNNNIL